MIIMKMIYMIHLLKAKMKNFAIMHIYIAHLSLYRAKTYQSLILNQIGLIKKQKNKRGGGITWVEKV